MYVYMLLLIIQAKKHNSKRYKLLTVKFLSQFKKIYMIFSQEPGKKTSDDIFAFCQ